VATGDYGALSPQTRLPAPKIEIWNAINQWSFVNFQNVKPRCTNVKPRYWRLSAPFIEREHSEIHQTADFVAWCSHGTEMKIFALARLWQVEWTVPYSNIGFLVDHTSSAWALLGIRNNAITQMFRDDQTKLGYCHRPVMVEVANRRGHSGGFRGCIPPTRPKKVLTWHLISLKIIAKSIFVLHITSLKMLKINLC